MIEIRCRLLHAEFDKHYIVVRRISDDYGFRFPASPRELNLGDEIEFRCSSNGDGQLVRMLLNGEDIGYVHVSAMHSLFIIGRDPDTLPFGGYVIAEPVDAEAIFAGVPVEDVYV